VDGEGDATLVYSKTLVMSAGKETFPGARLLPEQLLGWRWTAGARIFFSIAYLADSQIKGSVCKKSERNTTAHSFFSYPH